MAKAGEISKTEEIANGLTYENDNIKINANKKNLCSINISEDMERLEEIKKEIGDFKSTIHGKKFTMFKNLVDDCIEKFKDCKKQLLPYIMDKKGKKDKKGHTLQEYFKKLKDMEGTNESDIVDPELFLNLQIQKEINSFREIKSSLNTKLEDLKGKIGKVRSFDIIKKLKIIGSINNVEKALEYFQGARKSIKLRARKNTENGVVTYSTFVHSIFNYKKMGKLIYHTGMLGSLYDVAGFIKCQKDNCGYTEYNMKKLDKKEITEMQKLLSGGSKSYESSKKAFLTGINLCNKLFQNATSTKSIKPKTMIRAIKDVKSEINNIDLSDDIMRGEIEGLVNQVVENNIKKFGGKKEEDSPLKEQLRTLAEIYYYQTKSLEILKQLERLSATPEYVDKD